MSKSELDRTVAVCWGAKCIGNFTSLATSGSRAALVATEECKCAKAAGDSYLGYPVRWKMEWDEAPVSSAAATPTDSRSPT